MNRMSGEKLKGVPYTGTLPAVITGTKAGYLHKYKIYGNLTQNGTPTPSDPIYPSECGERTENIWTLTATDFYESTTVVGSAKEVIITGLTPSTQYTLTSNIRKTPEDSACLWFDRTSSIMNGVWDGQPRTATSSANGEIKVYYRSAILPEFNNYWYMLTAGSTAPTSYIPYGYKLPLTSAGQDVDIYLGESQTTRRIKKLVLTGEEVSTVDASSKQALIPLPDRCLGVVPLCSHYIGKITSAWSTIGNGEIAVLQQGSATARICDTTYATTASNYNNYLAQQYAAGTPVTIWYVLEEPETAVVNEPLRKIGDYADTIDSTQTSVQIPTTANSTTISWARSGLAPSEFDSIQEWVDIPTYKRVNGEWVADN